MHIKSSKKHFKNLSVLVFVNFGMAGLGFLTQIKVANILGREQFGLIAYALSVATYCTICIRYGVDRTLVRDLVQHKEDFSETLVGSLIVRIIMLLMVTLFLLVYNFAFVDEYLMLDVFLISASNVLVSFDLQGVFDSWNKMTRHALYFMSQKMIYYISIWCILFFRTDALTIYDVGIVTFMSMFVYLVLQYSYVARKVDFQLNYEHLKLIVRDVFKRNIYVWLAAIGGLSFGPLNQVLLKKNHSSGELGLFAVAWMFVTIVSMLLTQVARIGNPITARITLPGTSSANQKSFLLKYVLLMLSITIPISIVVIFYPQFIIDTFFNEEYSNSIPILQAMGVYIYIVALDLVALQFLLSMRLERQYMLSIFLGAMIGAVLCLQLIPSFGGIGAVYALIISHGLSVTLWWAVIYKKLSS